MTFGPQISTYLWVNVSRLHPPSPKQGNCNWCCSVWRLLLIVLISDTSRSCVLVGERHKTRPVLKICWFHISNCRQWLWGVSHGKGCRFVATPSGLYQTGGVNPAPLWQQDTHKVAAMSCGWREPPKTLLLPQVLHNECFELLPFVQPQTATMRLN